MKYYVDVDKEFEISEGKNIENYLMNKDIFAIENLCIFSQNFYLFKTFTIV